METQKNQHWRHCILIALDGLANAVIVTPLCMALWWSVWNPFEELATLIDSNSHPNAGAWLFFIVGIAGKCAMYLLQLIFQPCLTLEIESRLCIEVILRIEMYGMLIVNMAMWVGGWNLLDNLTGDNSTSAIITLILGLLGLLLLRSLNCAVTVPVTVDLDFNQIPFHYKTRLNSNPSRHGYNVYGLAVYSLDCLITAPIIDCLTLLFWRGGFSLLDIYILPNDPKLSAWITIAVGYGMFIIFLCLQIPVVRISNKFKSPSQRLLWKWAYWLVAFIVIALIWRGIWNNLDLYLYVLIKDLPCPHRYYAVIFTHIGLVLLTFILNIFVNDIAGFTDIDDATSDGRDLLQSSIFPCVSDIVTTYATNTAFVNNKPIPNESTALMGSL